MRIVSKWTLPMLMVSFIGLSPAAHAVNLYLRAGSSTCLYNTTTSQTLQKTSGTNQTSIAFSAQTNTFSFFSTPLTNAVLIASNKMAGGTIGVQNNGSAVFQFNASEIFYDYDPLTGNQTQIVAVPASGGPTSVKNGKSERQTLAQVQVATAYIVPSNHMLRVDITVTVNLTSGINGALIYNAPGGKGKSIVQLPTDNSINWPFGPFATTPNATITVPSSVQQNSTGNLASVANAGASAIYAWSITNGTITAGQSTPQITWTAGASGSVGLGVSIVNGCFSSGAAAAVVLTGKSNQTVTFNPIPTQTYGNSPVTLVATASSGLPVTFSVVSGPATVSGSTLTITGAGTAIVDANQAGNSTYNPGVAQQSFAINPVTLTVSGITASNKVYDGTTTAEIDTNGAVLDGVISGDSVTLDPTFAAGYFTNDTVGTGVEVDISGLDITGASAGNYTLVQPITSANITPAGLTVSGITASDKVYDGTTAATLNTGSAALVGVITGDIVTLDATSAAGVFADKNVGAGKTVTISGLAIAGTDAGNYTLTQPTATASITAAPLAVTATGINKVYDGTAAATVTLSDNRISGDSLSTSYTSASFSDKNVGTNKIVTVSGISVTGTDAGNYSYNTTATTTANITAVSVSGSVTANNKVYDGTTTATIATSSLTGVIGSDNISLTGGTAAFSDKNVGNGKTVIATGLSLSGADANNYVLASTSATNTANISAATLTVTANNTNRVYGAANPSFTAGYSGFVNGEDTSVLSGTPSLTTTATASSSVAGSPYAITAAQGTLSAANYTFNFVSGNLAVTAATLTVTANNTNRAYGAANPTFTAGYSGFVNGEDASVLSGAPSLTTAATASSSVAGSPYAITASQGTLSAANYSFSYVNGNLSITQATLTVSADNKSRPYGTTNPVLTASYSGFANGEGTNVLSGSPNLSTAADTNSPLGAYPIQTDAGTLSSGNYSFTLANGTLTVDSLPSILSIQLAGGSPSAVIVSTAGVMPSSSYHVLVSSNMLDWADIGTVQSTAGGTISFTNNVSGRAQFYRIYGP